MTTWIAFAKTAIPPLTRLLAVAIPAFTSKPASSKFDDVVPQQITELQAAVTKNADAVKVLATELKETIEGIDSGAAALEQELKLLRRLSAVSLIVACLALVAAAWALTR